MRGRESLIDFLANVVEKFTLISTSLETMKNRAVSTLDLAVRIRKGRLVMIGGQGNALLAFNGSLHLAEVQLPQSVVVLFDRAGQLLITEPRQIPAELVVVAELHNLVGEFL
jgi:hypothetical protein